MTIDAHQHFWKYDPIRYGWIDDSMALLKRDFLPTDLEPILQQNGIAGCVAVQAETSELDTHFLLELAAEHDFIKGVVGWIDLRVPNVDERLAYYAQFKKLAGFRHVVQAESDVNFMLRPDFRRGIQALQAHKFTYDILILPHQLGAALEFVRLFPEQAFVIDHLAKPYIKDGFIDGWKVLMQAIAKFPNVHCKISGMVTEAALNDWQYDDFVPYLDVVTEAFGPKRLLYGSDWPVCLLAGSYADVLSIVKTYTNAWSEEDKQRFFGKNAIEFYQLE